MSLRRRPKTISRPSLSELLLTLLPLQNALEEAIIRRSEAGWSAYLVLLEEIPEPELPNKPRLPGM